MDDERSLFEGKVKIYRRNGWWHTRIHLGGKQYHRKALRTANTALAEEAARKLYYETQFKQQEGLPIKSRSFEQVIEEYVAHHERSNEIGQNIRDKQRGEYTSDGMLRNIKRAARFWKEYAGKKSILAIDDKVMAGFVPFRRASTGESHPSVAKRIAEPIAHTLKICRLALSIANSNASPINLSMLCDRKLRG